MKTTEKVSSVTFPTGFWTRGTQAQQVPPSDMMWCQTPKKASQSYPGRSCRMSWSQVFNVSNSRKRHILGSMSASHNRCKEPFKKHKKHGELDIREPNGHVIKKSWPLRSLFAEILASEQDSAALSSSRRSFTKASEPSSSLPKEIPNRLSCYNET